MLVTTEQFESYRNHGFLLLPDFFSPEEVAILKGELPTVLAKDTPARVVEKEGDVVRSVYGSHTKNEVFRRLAQHPRLVEPVKEILGGEVYVYQFKINAKSAFDGDVWEWHQDYIFWLKEDGMPTSRVVNALIFLDEVNEFNGPLYLIPGSHREGVIEVPALDVSVMQQSNSLSPYTEKPTWIYNLTAKLKYSIDRSTVARLVSSYGIIAPKGPAGTVLLTHPNTVHGSSNNISPFDRAIVIITYNSVENIPISTTPPRPEFLVSRTCEPINSLADNVLLNVSAT